MGGFCSRPLCTGSTSLSAAPTSAALTAIVARPSTACNRMRECGVQIGIRFQWDVWWWNSGWIGGEIYSKYVVSGNVWTSLVFFFCVYSKSEN